MKVKIENPNDYELYVKKEISKINLPKDKKMIIRKICMQCFADGTRMTSGMLEVDVPS